MEDSLVIVLLLIFAIGCFVAVYIGSNVNRQKIQKMIELENSMKSICNLSGKTLYLNKQSPLFKEILLIKDYKVDTYKDIPVKVHVGSATVGGVTTGGVYTTGGGIEATAHSTDKCQLIYKVLQSNGIIRDCDMIEEIVLTKELSEKAKNSKIKDYFFVGKIQVVTPVKPSDYFVMLSKSGKNLEAMSQLKLEQVEGYPTREKCQAIIDWLCGE